MALTRGTRLGAYEIVAPLGAGGMGEVYRAKDLRLGREVAVKIVSERLIGNPDSLGRFEREMRAIAALSHPNILAIHDVGDDRGVMFAVMELLDGEGLDKRIAREAIGWRKAVEVAASIADGLASAHARGIVHRDLKPANIFLTADGQVKILDFGLAKHDAEGASGAASTFAATSAIETDPGIIFGTVGYMSPEQVKGEVVDQRADIFSLGCILYEMLTARRAFAGTNPAETFAAILRDQPDDLDRLAPGIPVAVKTVARRCLEKAPDERFQSARDLAFALRASLVPTHGAGDVEAPFNAMAASRPRFVRRRWLAALGATVLAGVALWLTARNMWPIGAGSTRIHSIAVLPLLSLSPGLDQEYFADAMTDELITRLAKLRTWEVTSRTSVMGYRGTTKKIGEISRELGVEAVVEGSVVREGPHVKITAQLFDGRTDRSIWADSYEREVESVLAIQADVAGAIAREVNLTLTPEATASLAPAGRIVPAAYDAYIRGRHAWDKRGETDLRDAIRFFQESIDVDPTYAPAYAGLADCYAQLGYGSYIAPEDAFPRASAAARRAIELDPTLAEAHASLGYVFMYYDWNFQSAEEELKRAIALNPSYAVAHQWYAYLLTAMERPIDEAEGEIAIAKRLDPLSVPILIDDAYILHYYDRNDDALRSVRRALEMNPKFPPGYFWLGRIYTSLGNFTEAEAALGHIGPLRTWTPAMAVLGYMYAKSGRTADARSILTEFEDLRRNDRYASGYAIAVVYAGLGDRERVFSALDAAYRERSHWLVWLKRDPRWNEVRSDVRFQNLVRQVGLR